MEIHHHCSGIFKTADVDNLDITHQCGCWCHKAQAEAAELRAEVSRLQHRADEAAVWLSAVRSALGDDTLNFDQLPEAVSRLQRRVEEAEAKQRIDERQCDDMTEKAALLAADVSRLQQENARLQAENGLLKRSLGILERTISEAEGR
jgi:chromosome segregation ATPase